MGQCAFATPFQDRETSDMANLITSIRFVLLFILVAMAYLAPPHWQLVNPVLLLVIIALDGLDGYVARKRGESSAFGSAYDIAVDRVVENVLWIVLADLELVPIWVSLVFITRGILVDTIRAQGMQEGKTAFEMMRSPLGRFLVSGRFMRGFYGAVKAVTFAWVLLFQPIPTLYPEFWSQWADVVDAVTHVLVYVSVAVCLIRGVPVVWEFYAYEMREQRRRLKGVEGNR